MDGQDYSRKQQDLIKENLAFYSIIPAEAKRYEQFTEAGLDVDDARDLTLELAGLEPEEEADAVSALQRYSAITESDLSDDDQLAALSAVMGEAEYGKVTTGYQFGVSPRAYVEVKKALALIDENSSITQDEAALAISGMLLPDAQKAVLWQLQNKSWKADNNPFSVTVGNQVRISLQAGGGEVTVSVGLPPLNPTGRLTLSTP